MSSEILARRYIEFSEKGIGPLKEFIKGLREEGKRAKEQMVILQKTLSSGTYDRVANRILNVRKELENLRRGAKLRDVIIEQNRLKKELASGDYLKGAQQMQAVKKAMEQMKRSVRFQDLVAQHGRFIGTMKFAQERTEALKDASGRAFAVMTAATMGWVTAGLAGTVEAKRLEMGFTRIGRGVASVFKPTIDSVTKGLHDAGQWFESLSEKQQENLRKTVLWTIGITGSVFAVTTLVGWVAKLSEALVTLGIVSEATAKKGLLGGLGELGGLLRSGGKKGLLARLGVVGLTGLGIEEGTAGGLSSALGWIHNGTVGRLTRTGEERDRSSELRKLEMREAWFGTPWLPNLGDKFTDAEKKRLAELRGDKPAERVSIAGGQFGELGSTWERLQSSVMEQGADDATVILKDIGKGISEIRNFLTNQIGQLFPNGKEMQ